MLFPKVFLALLPNEWYNKIRIKSVHKTTGSGSLWFFYFLRKEKNAMPGKRKPKVEQRKINYQTAAEARATAGGIPVFCAFDSLVDPKSLIGNPRNPNQHPAEQITLLAQIIQSQGWRAPITVSNQSGFVVRGHGRLAAALAFGAEVVPVDYQNYANEAEEWADLIADNRLSELSEIDNVKIADLIVELDNGEVPLELTGYTNDDMENLLAAISGEGDAEADGLDEVPDVPEIPMSKPGDLWLLGEHRVLCGSATDPEIVKRLMDGKKAHLVFTDPPYGVEYTGGKGKTWEMIDGDDKTGEDLSQKLLIPAFKNMVANTIDTAAFYIWHAGEMRRPFEDAMTAAGLIEKQYIIWVKNNFQLGHLDYHWAHEPCFYAQKAGQSARFYGDRTNRTAWKVSLRKATGIETVLTGGVVVTDGAGSKLFITEKPPKDKKNRYLRVTEKDSVVLYSDSKASTAWEVDRETSIEHPTQKPVELALRAIGNSSAEGEIVLDLFGGSGTTLIGAEKLHRAAYLTEIDPKYVDVIVNRYVKTTGNLNAVCVREGKEIPYIELKTENDAQNGHESEMR